MRGRDESLGICTRGRPQSQALYDICNQSEEFSNLLQITTFSNLDEVDSFSMLSNADIPSSPVNRRSPCLYYIVFNFFNHLKTL